MTGFKKILDELTRITKGAWPDRFSEVAHPAFEYNWTELWKSPGSVAIDDDAIWFVWNKIPEDLLPAISPD